MQYHTKNRLILILWEPRDGHIQMTTSPSVFQWIGILLSVQIANQYILQGDGKSTEEHFLVWSLAIVVKRLKGHSTLVGEQLVGRQCARVVPLWLGAIGNFRGGANGVAYFVIGDRDLFGDRCHLTRDNQILVSFETYRNWIRRIGDANCDIGKWPKVFVFRRNDVHVQCAYFTVGLNQLHRGDHKKCNEGFHFVKLFNSYSQF